MCDAIEAVTRGVDGAHLSHVAIVFEVTDAQVTILEAYAHGVAVVLLPDFLARSHDACGRPKVLVGRLQRVYVSAIPEALHRGDHLLGMPYDEHFLLKNGAYYCSELIYDIFDEPERPVFHLAPMTFRAPHSEHPAPVWASHFQHLGEPVPEGKLGINPGAMSRNPAVEIVHAFGAPAGWNGPRELLAPCPSQASPAPRKRR